MAKEVPSGTSFHLHKNVGLNVGNNINEKTFERICFRYTGYSPGTLKRIKRFQTTSNQLVQDSSVNLSSLAYDNNYSDQSHFIKEFQKFSGVPPRTFQRERISVKENTEYKYH